MELTQRKLIRLAEKIHHQLRLLQGSRYGEVTRRTTCLMENLEQLRRTGNLLAVCVGRNWNAAADQMTDRIVQNLRDLPYYAGEIERMVEASKLKLPAIRDIVADLEQAQEEFENLKHVEDGDLLVVTTEAIELEGYWLGEFEIRLQIGSLSEFKRHSAVYRVVALDPHPAACNDAVTHPHVSDEHMCEGDAGAAIEAALTNGRICDFFQLVTAVLTNYNPNSPYVALADWEGRPCYDCGYTMGADEIHWCSSCEEDFCDECTSYCRRCDETTCSGCLEECSACGDLVCPSCKMKCPECSRLICKTCHEEGQCPCVQEREEQQEQENDNDREHVEAQSPNATATVPPTTLPNKSESKQPEKTPQKQSEKKAEKPRAVIQPPAAPVLRFSPVAWAKLLHFRDRQETEVGGFAVTSAGDLLKVEDFITVKQDVTMASVSFDDQAVADFFEAQVDAGRKPEQFGRIWLHTHPGNSPAPSSTDEETFARVFGSCQWAVMFVLARGGKSYARLRFNVGPGGSMVVPVEVDFGAPFGPSQQEAWEAEYKANIDATPWTWGLGTHDVFDRGLDKPSSLSRASVPDDWMEELEAMEPAERQLILDELSVRPDLWGDQIGGFYD